MCARVFVPPSCPPGAWGPRPGEGAGWGEGAEGGVRGSPHGEVLSLGVPRAPGGRCHAEFPQPPPHKQEAPREGQEVTWVPARQHVSQLPARWTVTGLTAREAGPHPQGHRGSNPGPHRASVCPPRASLVASCKARAALHFQNFLSPRRKPGPSLPLPLAAPPPIPVVRTGPWDPTLGLPGKRSGFAPWRHLGAPRQHQRKLVGAGAGRGVCHPGPPLKSQVGDSPAPLTPVPSCRHDRLPGELRHLRSVQRHGAHPSVPE